MTAPQLFAAAHGTPCPAGAERCFYCGASCGPEHPIGDNRSDGFTGWAEVARPASGFVCGGCSAVFDESDVTRRTRAASWVLNPADAARVPKFDLATLRTACLSPPAPPFAIVLAVSGQKHLIYRAPVNLSPAVVAVQLENERIEYRPAELAERLDLCGRVVAASGKPAVQGEPSASLAVRLSAYWADPGPPLRWFAVWDEPASRLAAFLCPNQEQARERYPSDAVPAGRTARPAGAAPTGSGIRLGRVPAAAGGPGGPGLFG